MTSNVNELQNKHSSRGSGRGRGRGRSRDRGRGRGRHRGKSRATVASILCWPTTAAMPVDSINISRARMSIGGVAGPGRRGAVQRSKKNAEKRSIHLGAVAAADAILTALSRAELLPLLLVKICEFVR